MGGPFRALLLLPLLSPASLQADARPVRDNDIAEGQLHPFFHSAFKRELPGESIYRRPLRCLDMVAVEGVFTFTARRPGLSCAAFFIARPDEVISFDYVSVDIDCRGGDFIKVFDGWVMTGEMFPSAQDHPLPLYERYMDYCDPLRRGVRSSQNVAMVFFHIHKAGSGFTLTVRKLVNPFPCNIISQTPEGTFSMVSPHQQRSCSFSIIYPAEIQISEFSLDQQNDFAKRSTVGCSEAGDYVELLGGNGMDTSKMFSVAAFCSSFTWPTRVKMGCDNTVVRVVSSGRFVSRVSFSYRSLKQPERQQARLSSLEEFCFNKRSHQTSS